jgi:hypothetical protein
MKVLSRFGQRIEHTLVVKSLMAGRVGLPVRWFAHQNLLSSFALPLGPLSSAALCPFVYPAKPDPVPDKR